MELEAKDWVAVAALVLSIISLLLTVLEKRRASREVIIKALQGEKEAVGYMAYQVAIEGLPGDKTFRSQLLTSLCLAGIFEGSDRTRALVYSALEKCVNEERELVTKRLNTIEKTFDKYERLLDLERGRRRLAGIRNALGITTNTP